MESWGELWHWEAEFNHPGAPNFLHPEPQHLSGCFGACLLSFFCAFPWAVITLKHLYGSSQVVWCSMSSSSEVQPIKRWSSGLWSFIWESISSNSDKFWLSTWVSAYILVLTLPKVLSSKSRNHSILEMEGTRTGPKRFTLLTKDLKPRDVEITKLNLQMESSFQEKKMM